MSEYDQVLHEDETTVCLSYPFFDPFFLKLKKKNYSNYGNQSFLLCYNKV